MVSFLSFSFLLLLSSSLLYSSAQRKELQDKQVEKGSNVQPGGSFQYSSVNPNRVLQLSWRPRVFFYQGFLSEEECEHLISLGAEERASGHDSYWNAGIKRQLASLGFQLNLPDSIVARIEERISAWTFLPRENSEPMQVMHYEPERAEQNLDYFSDISRLESSEPFMAMIILYLSNVTRGGEVIFPDLEVKSEVWSDCSKTASILKPSKGNAILFFTRHLNGSLDEMSSHARCPVTEGDMWCATKFFYIRAVKKERRSIEQGDSECTDEDDSCPRWAALGECQRNPVYMMGSPDYFGTCRKSCKAC